MAYESERQPVWRDVYVRCERRGGRWWFFLIGFVLGAVIF